MTNLRLKTSEVFSIFVYIYASYTRPASELNCLRLNLSELLILLGSQNG